MPDAVRSRTLSRILDDPKETTPDGTSDKEWQKVQAFSLRVELGGSRGVEGFAWAHYSGYRLWEEGNTEHLALLFGPRALVLAGHNLRHLLQEIDDGRRRTIRQISEPEAKLALHEGELDKPLVTEIRCIPAIDDILKELQGEDDHGKGGHARRIQR